MALADVMARRYPDRTKPIGFYPLPVDHTEPEDFLTRFRPFPVARGRTGMIYVHVPFCGQRCGFCRFYAGRYAEDRVAVWLEGIRREAATWARLRSADASAAPVEAVFFGGGTPSSLGPDNLRAVLGILRDEFPFVDSPEITVEWYPKDAHPDTFQAAVESGVDRVSFGIQSWNQETLDRLGAHHTPEQAEIIVAMAREAGLRNVNIDVMANVPGQTRDEHLADIEHTLAQQPAMISVNPLELAAGTPLGEKLSRDAVSAEEQRSWLLAVREILREHGYRNQRTRNFARDGWLHRYNRATDGIAFDIIPLGPGAYGFVSGWAVVNRPSFAEWDADSRKTGSAVYALAEPAADEMRRAFVVNSLLELGLDEVEYRAQFGSELAEDFEVADELESLGVFVRMNGRLHLVDEAQSYADEVSMDFYSSSQATLFDRHLSMRRSSGGTQYFPVVSGR